VKKAGVGGREKLPKKLLRFAKKKGDRGMKGRKSVILEKT